MCCQRLEFFFAEVSLVAFSLTPVLFVDVVVMNVARVSPKEFMSFGKLCLSFFFPSLATSFLTAMAWSMMVARLTKSVLLGRRSGVHSIRSPDVEETHPAPGAGGRPAGGLSY